MSNRLGLFQVIEGWALNGTGVQPIVNMGINTEQPVSPVPRPPNPSIPVSWVEALTRALRLNQGGVTQSSRTMCPVIIGSRAD